MTESKAAKAKPLDTLAKVNDLGKPWRFEEDGYTVTRTAIWSPPGCHPVGCGLKLYVDADGKLAKVEGDENHPVTQGRLCPRCVALKDYIYNPSRVTQPLKRARQDRGKADKWIPTTWDDAFDIIEKEYKRIVDAYGYESIAIFVGTGREGGTLTPYATMTFHTPNFCYTQSGYACYAPRCEASIDMCGIVYPEIDYAGALEGRYDDPRYTLPEVLIVWGKAPLESNPDGFFGHAVIDLMKRGTRLIVIDPRVNWLSTRADYHLRLRAGTDTALGMAMINVIAEEGLYDKDFVECWCYGFDELVERCRDMTPEKAAEICGLDAQDIRDVARMYAEAKPAQLQWGLAFDQKTNGIQNGQVAISLIAITGNMDIPGGHIAGNVHAGHNEAGFNYEKSLGDLIPKTIGMDKFPLYVTANHQAQADAMLEALETGKPYPIKMGVYAGNNLAACTSMEPKRWIDAIAESTEFGIAIDIFITPSAQACCEIILPVKSVAERIGASFTFYGSTPVTTNFMNDAIEVGDCRSDLEIAFTLGKRLNPQSWEQYETVDDFISHLRLGGHEDIEEARKDVVRFKPIEYRKYETGDLRLDGKPGFNTPTGRIELFSTVLQSYGEDPLPYYQEPPFSPVSTPELSEEYPFVLTTGARSFAFFHSEHRQIPYLRELNPNPIVEINPEVAKEKGIADGQWVEIYNSIGSCIQKAKITETVDRNTIHAQHAWWFPEQDGNYPNLFGTYQSNINNLIPNHHTNKIGYCAPVKSMICNIRPVQECYDVDMNDIWEKFKIEGAK